MKERKQYTKEFKEGATRLVTEQGRAVADVAKSLGVSPWTMSRWVRAAKTEGSDAFRGHGQRTPLGCVANIEMRQRKASGYPTYAATPKRLSTNFACPRALLPANLLTCPFLIMFTDSMPSRVRSAV